MLKLLKLFFRDITLILKKIYRYYYWNLKGVSVDFSCQISVKANISKNCYFTGISQISGHSIIGKNTYGHNVNIHHSIIGEFCSIGPDVKIGLDEHPLDRESTHPKFFGIVDQKKSIIENHVWIGANCVILGGVKIGEHAVIAAGAVVTKDVTSNTIVGGVPAVVIKNRLKN